MEPFEVIERRMLGAATIAAGLTRSSIMRPGAASPAAVSTSQENESRLVNASTKSTNVATTNNSSNHTIHLKELRRGGGQSQDAHQGSPTRSPHRAVSPTRAIAPITSSLLLTSTTTTTAAAPAATIGGGGGARSGRLAPIHHQPVHNSMMGAGVVRTGVLVDMTPVSEEEEEEEAAPTTATAHRQPQQQQQEGVNVLDLHGGGGASDDDSLGGVAPWDYMTSCDDIKLVAKEREEFFPRYEDVPAELQISSALLQTWLASSSTASSSSTSPFWVAGAVGRLMVSQTTPSAVRSVIPSDALEDIEAQLMMTRRHASRKLNKAKLHSSKRSTSSGGDAPLWIDSEGRLRIDLSTMSVSLIRNIANGAALPLRLVLPYYTEDTSVVIQVRSAVTGQMEWQPRRSPLYTVDVVIGSGSGSESQQGGSTSAAVQSMRMPPAAAAAAQKSAAAKKLYHALNGTMEPRPTRPTGTVGVDSTTAHVAPHASRSSAPVPEAKTTNSNPNPKSEDVEHEDDAITATSEPLSTSSLPSLPIHTFRPLPRMVGPSYCGVMYLVTQPLCFLRSVSDICERQMLRKDLEVDNDRHHGKHHHNNDNNEKHHTNDGGNHDGGASKSNTTTTTTATTLSRYLRPATKNRKEHATTDDDMDEEATQHPPRPSTASSVVLSRSEADSAITTLLSRLEAMLAHPHNDPTSVQPLLLQLVPLLMQVATPEALERASTLARLRVQLQCRALGLSERALFDTAEALSLPMLAGGLHATAFSSAATPATTTTSTIPTSFGTGAVDSPQQLRFIASLLLHQLDVSEPLMQFIVECAHLHKHIGKLYDARRWYRVGLLVASLLRGDPTSSNASGGGGAGRRSGGGGIADAGRDGALGRGSQLISSDETALLPFLKALGDVSLALGHAADAVTAYEAARALSDMKAQLEHATSTSTSENSGSGVDPLTHSLTIRTLEYEASLAIAAALGQQTQTAHTAYTKCCKALDDSDVVQSLLAIDPSSPGILGNQENVTSSSSPARTRRPLPSQPILLDAAKTAVELFCHIAVYCVMRDRFRQATKHLNDAHMILDKMDAYLLQQQQQQDNGGGSSSGTIIAAAVRVMIIQRADVHMIRGWCCLRRSILVSAIAAALPPGSAQPTGAATVTPPTVPIGLGTDPASADDDDNESDVVPPNRAEALEVSLLDKAAELFHQAAVQYDRAGGPDGAVLASTAIWLQYTCCHESRDATQHLYHYLQGRVSPNHLLGASVASCLVLLNSESIKLSQQHHQRSVVADDQQAVLVPLQTFNQLAKPLLQMSSLVAHDNDNGQTQQHRGHHHHPVNNNNHNNSGILSAVPHHPLVFVMWEMNAVGCALIDRLLDACDCLDAAAQTYGSSTAVTRATSTAGSDVLLSLVEFVRRDAVMVCRRIAPLVSFCFTTALHHASQQQQPSLASTKQGLHHRDPALSPASSIEASSPVILPATILHVERMVLSLVRDLGLDQVQPNRGAAPSNKQQGIKATMATLLLADQLTIAPHELPGLFLDLAELRLCLGDPMSCLENCGRAIRLADDRNLLYLLGPLFKPAFQLKSSEVEDRNRLMRERRADLSTSMMATSSSSIRPKLSGGASKSTTGLAGAAAVVGPPPMLALALFTMARGHEVAGNFAQAFSIYLQTTAAFEMMMHTHQPAAVEAMLGCSRTSLQLGNIGDGLMYADLAMELFVTYHAAFGGYRATPMLVQLKRTVDCCKLVSETMASERHYTLAPHELRYASPALNGHPLYV